MKASDLKGLCKEARPVIERQLDDAELLAGFREAATEKGIDWSQVKALLKAQIQDERDGKQRVQAIIEKADNASAYAGMLGLANMNENNFSADSQEPMTNVIAGPIGGGMSDATPEGIPTFLERKRETATA